MSARAFETTGVLESQRQLRLDAPLPLDAPSRVRVIVLFPADELEEFDEAEWLHAATTSPSFDFLRDSREDIYTLADGRPFDDQG